MHRIHNRIHNPLAYGVTASIKFNIYIYTVSLLFFSLFFLSVSAFLVPETMSEICRRQVQEIRR